MRRLRTSALGLMILVLAAGCTDRDLTTQPAHPGDALYASTGAHDRIEGRYIVVLSAQPAARNAAAAAALDAVTADLSRQPGARVDRTYRNALSGFAAQLTDEQAEMLRKDPRVRSVQQDSYVQLPGIPTVQEYPTWGLDRIDQRELLLDRAYAYTGTGRGVTIYNVDSGIRYTHTEFGGRASNGHDFQLEDDPANTDPTQGPGEDCRGHGTHVAGTLAGTTYGVAKEASVVSVRIFGCVGGSTRSRVIAAVDWVTADHLARRAQDPLASSIANLEVVGPAGDDLDDAVRTMIGAGVTAVAAAGNNGAVDGACALSPSRVAEAMTIGATNIDNSRASFSNHGACVDWFAPGRNITSASHLEDSETRVASGTSMAMPHTAGVAAIYLEANPGASPAEVFSALRAATTGDVVTIAAPGANHMLHSLFQPVSFTPPTHPDLNLSTSGARESGNQVVYLTWEPAGGAFHDYVRIFRDGGFLPPHRPSSGSFRDDTGAKGRDGTWVHQVCEAFYDNCSARVTTVFGDGGGGGGDDPPPPSGDGPTASFTYRCQNTDTCQFTDTSTSGGSAIVAWLWTSSAGHSETTQHTSVTFGQAGSYTVTLRVTDGDQRSDEASAAVNCSMHQRHGLRCS
jgi:subtilisin family serine protease